MINKRLIHLVEGCKKWILATVLTNWISLLFNIIAIISIANYMELIYLNGVDIKSTANVFAIVFITIIVRFLCNYNSSEFSSRCAEDSKTCLRKTIYNKLLDLGVHYNEKNSTSEVVQVAIDGIEQLEIYFGRYLPQFFYSLLAPLTLFVVVSFISFKAAMVLLICVPLIPMSIVAIMKIAKKLLASYWGVYVNLGDTFLENLQGLTTLKIYQRDGEKNEKMNLEAENFRKITMKVLLMQLNSINIMDLIAFGGSAVGIIIALKQLAIGKISMSGAISIILLSAEFFIPLRLLGSFFHIAMNGMAAAEKIFKIIDTPVENFENKEVENLNNINIKFRNFDFSYEEDRRVLENVNLDIKNGNLTALVGASGCGKSTISNIIMGFYRNYNGEVLINDVELKNISEKQLRRKINLVNHNSYIFTGTIEENLKMGKADARKEEMYRVLKQVNLYDFVMSLEDGLSFKIKDGGSNLSGGQKQRLALARALLYDSEIYIFDEATSNIDVESENEIMQVVHELAKEKTVILISHRLYNVRKAQSIYVLKDGQVKECGNHRELMSKKGEYFNLVNEQQQLEKIGGEECA
ncbi:ABC transporter ATP-binding protein/permease [Haloimpatiens lingqiaonensis]|uniref:ABC transporter ATP-binding protein/permease n=1 Tax=Haloimpatiens lingqiaonensis TaxID=1380675 RepID=UPI0010FF0107|nr:ABC transporter ATP-binding protein/permease [Haloimpatiens lingqiaonensis]